MNLNAPFYYPVVTNVTGAQIALLAPAVQLLPVFPEVPVVILGEDVGELRQGMYVYRGKCWRLVLPLYAVSQSIIRGDAINIFSDLTAPQDAPTGSFVWVNGGAIPGLTMDPGNSIYVVQTPPATGGGAGAVASVNGQTGIVVINATNLPGLATVGRTGSYNDLTDKPAPYTLAAATPTALGGVIVPAASNLSIDGSGNIDIDTAFVNTVNSKLASAAPAGTGTSLIMAQAAGVLTLKSLSANTGLTLIDDGAGNLTIMGTAPYTLPNASASTLGGVKVGSGLSIDGSGVLTANVQALNPATASTLGGVKVGGGLAVTADGTLSATATPYVLPIASSTVLGGFKVGSGLAIDGTGVLSASGSSYTLPAATVSTLGGVKVGSGLSVAGDGTLSADATALATTTTTGVVKVGSGLNVAGDGTLSAQVNVASASTLGQVRVGSGLSIDGSGILSVSASSGVASINSKTGAVTISGGSGITVDNSGANVVLNLALTSGLVTTALGFTPYNATNPSGYISANQNITYTGDATGSGTTAVTLTLANSGVSAGTFKSVTVDAKGRVTAGTNPTTLTGFGITDALNSVSGGSVSGTITLTGGAKVTGLPTPTVGGDAANKTYVDNAIASVANGTSWRANAQAATTTNITLSGTQTIDGYAVQVGDRVLVKDQTDQTQNGIYVADTGAWTRATDADTGAELLGAAILVLNGTVNPLSQWVNTNTGSITVGTTNITFTKLQGNGVVYSAGTGLTLTGNTFSITNTGVTAGTYTKVTVNQQGQVTTGANLAASDVTTALGYTPYNSTNPNNYISANQTITVSGDATASGTTSLALTLANSGVTAGTYKSVTVDAKGRVTAGTNPTTLSGFGITDGLSGTAGGSLTGTITLSGAGLITGVPTPSGNTDAANKLYVDNATSGLLNSVPWKQMVAAASTGNLSSAGGLLVVDGYQTVAGDRVLAKDQSDPTTNGIWIVAAGAWTRAPDSTTGAQIKNQIVMVLNGTTQARTIWLNTNTGTVTVGSTAINYAATASGSTYSAGTGLTLTGTTFSLTNTAVTPGTYTKVTVNQQGQVTTGAALASSDVTTALGFTPLQNNQTITLSGDVTGSGSTAITTTLANSGVTAGTYTSVTVDAKGRVTAGGSISNAQVVSAIGYTPLNKAGDSVTGVLKYNYQNIAAASTMAVSTVNANTLNVLGSTTVNGFDSSLAGDIRDLTFQGVNTLVHAPGAFILPTSANITTAIGDSARFICLGGSNWQCLAYMKVSGQALAASPDPTKLPLSGGTLSGALNEAPLVTVASAATTAIGAAAANSVNISGTTTITAFDTVAAGFKRVVVFQGALTLTHNATSLILPGGASITTAAGDVAEFVSLGSGNWRCLYYTRVAAGAGYATLSGAETLTNKTLVNPVITGFTESGATASSAAYTIDLSLGTDFEITTTANLTVTLPAAAAGKSYTLAVVYGGAHTVTFTGGTAIKYPGGVQPVSTSVAGKIDLYVMKCNRAGNTTFVQDGGRNF
jgi:phage-related tail fiber protein